MRSVAVSAAASLVVLLTACAPDRPVASQLAETATPAAESERPRSFPSHVGPPGTEVRDAREAAEDAARRILDATVHAAGRIREVGVGAVQAIQPARAEDEPATGKVADANAAADPESVQARN